MLEGSLFENVACGVLYPDSVPLIALLQTARCRKAFANIHHVANKLILNHDEMHIGEKRLTYKCNNMIGETQSLNSMSRQEDGDAHGSEKAISPEKGSTDMVFRRGIEAGEYIVHDDKLFPSVQCSCESQPLLLATTQRDSRAPYLCCYL